MRTLLAVLFGGFVGWTSSVVYFVGQEERHVERLEAERKERRRAEREAEAAQSRILSRDVELDRLRRLVMKYGVEWWRLPAVEGERIPPQNVPTTPKE